ncbi:hypothetical protein BKA61DRAFT_689549 [Leptodontidium sp. MPI-SDFR-AT-0119]|nr:hypothetical protein BKA61DRAFT_689549 [Leptodontidium sp. MPI-SDFR-AT-0119]
MPTNRSTAQNSTKTACSDPGRDKRKIFDATKVLFTLATFSVIVRFFVRFSDSDSGLWWDDAVVLALFVLNLGLGKDIWTISFEKITPLLKLYWVNEILYFLSISLLKIAFLLFFFRIFPSRRFRQIVWCLVGLNTVLAITYVIIVCTICRPLYYMWTQWEGEHEGSCIDMNTLAFANAGIGILLDLVTLGLPISQIRRLQLGLRKKIAVSSMLSVGIIVTIISILRLRSLVNFAKTSNQTWDLFDPGLWSMTEIDIGLICVCMPSYRVLFIRICTPFRSSSVDSGTSQKRFSVNPNLMARIECEASGRVERRQSAKSEGIAYERKYGVEFTDRAANGSVESVVQMVEIQGGDGRRSKSVA